MAEWYQPGYRAPRHAEAAPTDRVLWTLVLRGQSAQAVVREYPHGRELRVSVTSRLLWSQLFRPGDVPTLDDVASEHLDDFTQRGWVHAE